MRGLLDDVDEVRIERELEPLGERVCAGRAVRDDGPRLCDHPGDRKRPADRRRRAEPQRQPRRQAESAKTDDDQQIFESAFAQAIAGGL